MKACTTQENRPVWLHQFELAKKAKLQMNLQFILYKSCKLILTKASDLYNQRDCNLDRHTRDHTNGNIMTASILKACTRFSYRYRTPETGTDYSHIIVKMACYRTPKFRHFKNERRALKSKRFLIYVLRKWQFLKNSRCNKYDEYYIRPLKQQEDRRSFIIQSHPVRNHLGGKTTTTINMHTITAPTTRT